MVSWATLKYVFPQVEMQLMRGKSSTTTF